MLIFCFGKTAATNSQIDKALVQFEGVLENFLFVYSIFVMSIHFLVASVTCCCRGKMPRTRGSRDEV